MFKVTARDQGHYKGPSGAFVTYCNISCFFLINFFKDKYCLSGLTEGNAYFGFFFCTFIFFIFYFNLIKHQTANFIIIFFFSKDYLWGTTINII